MKTITKALILVSNIYLVSPALAGETAAPADARVYFVNLMDGDQISTPFTINFGLSGMGVAPAGTEKANTGCPVMSNIFISAVDKPKLQLICPAVSTACNWCWAIICIPRTTGL